MARRSEPALRDIQAWLHTFVVAPGDSDEALAEAERAAGFKPGSDIELVGPSPTLQPRERLEIYRGMYLLRMEEALEIDFPAVQDRVGKRAFFDLVASYVEAHPSHSYTLDHLGRYFPDYLGSLPGNAFLAELAALEWSICETSIAHNASVVNMADMASVASDCFVNLTFTLIPALRTLRFSHNVNAVYRQWSQENVWLSPQAEETYVVVWRQDLEVWRRDLEPAAYKFLELLRVGRPLGEALDLVIEAHQITEEQCFEWFQEWLAEGFFHGYQIYRESES